MAGTIKHEWDGTTLIITSDSGTSSMDLKGQKGDAGIRGPQGAVGSIDTTKVYTTNNPPTCADVKAAPAGYGLGTIASLEKWNGDANTLTAQGWYRLESGTTNGVGESAAMRVDGYSSTDLTQTAYTRTGLIKQRTCKSGTWSAWVDCSPSAFAPAGYGLGGYAKMITNSYNLDLICQCGWYRWDASVPANAPKFHNNNNTYCYMFVYGDSADAFTQVVYSAHNDARGVSLTRSFTNGITDGWEWVNPPMIIGTEYRTTERWNGKPVHTKLIDFGALPNATSGYAYNVIPAEAELVSVNGYIKNSSTGSQSSIFPFVTDIWKLKNNAYIGVKTNKDMTAYNAYILLKYVK
jgi:hypothetical protein